MTCPGQAPRRVALARAAPAAARRAERGEIILVKKRFLSSVIQWQHTALPLAPAGPSRSSNPSKPDGSLWVGPAAMAWLRADEQRRIKQSLTSPVEGFLAPPPDPASQGTTASPRRRSASRSPLNAVAGATQQHRL